MADTLLPSTNPDHFCSPHSILFLVKVLLPQPSLDLSLGLEHAGHPQNIDVVLQQVAVSVCRSDYTCHKLECNYTSTRHTYSTATQLVTFHRSSACLLAACQLLPEHFAWLRGLLLALIGWIVRVQMLLAIIFLFLSMVRFILVSWL